MRGCGKTISREAKKAFFSRPKFNPFQVSRARASSTKLCARLFDMSSAVDGMPAPARAVGGARAAAAAPSEEPASLPNEAASNSDATELSNITKDTAFVEVEDEEPNPAPPAQVDLSPEERFEEYPFLNNPLFAKSGPLGAVLKYLVLGPDVTTPRRGVLPDFYADGRVIKEGRKSAPTNDGPAVNAKRRNSVLSIGSTASADRPWTRYDMYPAFWKTMITAVCGITGVLGALTGSVFSPALRKLKNVRIRSDLS